MKNISKSRKYEIESEYLSQHVCTHRQKNGGLTKKWRTHKKMADSQKNGGLTKKWRTHKKMADSTKKWRTEGRLLKEFFRMNNLMSVLCPGSMFQRHQGVSLILLGVDDGLERVVHQVLDTETYQVPF